METTIRKPRLGAVLLAVLMLLFGALMSLFGYFDLSEWRSERAPLIACGLVWIIAGRLNPCLPIAQSTMLIDCAISFA